MSESSKIEWISPEGEPLRRWRSLPVFKQVKPSADAILNVDACAVAEKEIG
jgi:hypothetical protein